MLESFLIRTFFVVVVFKCHCYCSQLFDFSREHLLGGLITAFRYSSVVVTTGGVSMGEKDLMKEVLEKDLKFKVRFISFCHLSRISERVYQ